MANDVLNAFSQYFEMVAANTNKLKDEVFKLRYQVYCIETGFEDPQDHIDGSERDSSDDRSVHYLIRHRKSGIYAATTRLVLPDADDIDKPFPIEEHCEIDNVTVMEQIPRQQLAEVSRFCVSKEFKKRKGEPGTLTGIGEDHEAYFTKDERRIFPHITLALIACLVRMSQKHNVAYWYAVMEPSLLRFLSRLGIYFIKIGPPVDYRGLRQPGIAKVENILTTVQGKNVHFWRMLTNQDRFLNINDQCSQLVD